MIMKTRKRNHVIILTITVMVLMMASLTGCSQKAETQEASNAATGSTAETNVGEAEKSTEEVEVSSEVTPEQTADSASAPTPEPATEVVYEGIDMESDLPGEEWIQTFEGVVDEPVAIIYNDSTGRKEIIQEGSTVNLSPEGDIIAVYLPEGEGSPSFNMPATGATIYYRYAITKLDETIVKEGSKYGCNITVKDDGEEWIVNFKVIVE